MRYYCTCPIATIEYLILLVEWPSESVQCCYNCSGDGSRGSINNFERVHCFKKQSLESITHSGTCGDIQPGFAGLPKLVRKIFEVRTGSWMTPHSGPPPPYSGLRYQHQGPLGIDRRSIGRPYNGMQREEEWQGWQRENSLQPLYSGMAPMTFRKVIFTHA